LSKPDTLQTVAANCWVPFVKHKRKKMKNYYKSG